MGTIKEVAERAEVSVGTVSNDTDDRMDREIRLRPELKIRESSLGYRPALSAAERKPNSARSA